MTKPCGLFEDPKDYFKSPRDSSRQNSCREEKPREVLKPASIFKQPTPSPDPLDDSWVAIPKREASSESVAKSAEHYFGATGCGVLLEFRPKTAVIAEMGSLPKPKKVAESEAEPPKGISLRRLPTPCSDQQNETASFGEKARRESTDDYVRQTSRFSDETARTPSREDPTKSLLRKPSLFGSSESTITVIKCGPAAPETGKVCYQQSGVNDSMNMQRGSSLGVEAFQRSCTAAADYTKRKTGIIATIKEEECEAKDNTAISKNAAPAPETLADVTDPKKEICQRIVKIMDPDKLTKLKNYVYKNILKVGPLPIIGLSDPKETNTKGMSFKNSSCALSQI